MAKRKKTIPDIEECKKKIKLILEQYNCSLISADDYSNVLIYDHDTLETINAQN